MSPLSSFRMVSRKAVAALLLVHMATMLASQIEAFVPIFTYGELQKMQVRTPLCRGGGSTPSSAWQKHPNPTACQLCQ